MKKFFLILLFFSFSVHAFNLLLTGGERKRLKPIIGKAISVSDIKALPGLLAEGERKFFACMQSDVRNSYYYFDTFRDAMKLFAAAQKNGHNLVFSYTEEPVEIAFPVDA